MVQSLLSSRLVVPGCQFEIFNKNVARLSCCALHAEVRVGIYVPAWIRMCEIYCSIAEAFHSGRTVPHLFLLHTKGDIEDQPCTPYYCLVQHLSHRVATLPGGGSACLCVQLSIKASNMHVIAGSALRPTVRQLCLYMSRPFTVQVRLLARGCTHDQLSFFKPCPLVECASRDGSELVEFALGSAGVSI